MKSTLIVDYCKAYYPVETELIARSLINYYSIRNKLTPTDIEVKLQNRIYAGVIKLFRNLAKDLSNELGYSENEIFEELFVIHIKT